MFIRMRKAQSSLEYIIIFTAITVIFLAFARQKLSTAIQGILDTSATKVTTALTNF